MRGRTTTEASRPSFEKAEPPPWVNAEACRGAGRRTGASHGRASHAWAGCGLRVLGPTLTPMPRTPVAWISPRHGFRLADSLEDCLDRSPCGCPPIEPGPNWDTPWG